MSPLSACPSVPPGSLEGLPKQELEQRLRSHMINVVVLFQQLDASRGQKSTPAGPPPSQLRDVLVQTDHTELNQVRPDIPLHTGTLGSRGTAKGGTSKEQGLELDLPWSTKIMYSEVAAIYPACVFAMEGLLLSLPFEDWRKHHVVVQVPRFQPNVYSQTLGIPEHDCLTPSHCK